MVEASRKSSPTTGHSHRVDASGAGSLNASDQRIGVDQTSDPISKAAGEPSSAPRSDQVEKVVVVCPNCQATLRVRRVHIGNPVRCKQCQDIFTVPVPPDPEARPVDELTRGNAESSTRQLEIEREIRRLTDELNRVRTERIDLCAERDRATTELNKMRASLGEFTPAEVRPLAAERDSLRALVLGLGSENKALQATLEDRDQAIRRQADGHHAELQRHVQALDLARHLHREAIERLEADLVATGEQHGQLQEELQARADSCTQLQDRIVELEKAQERITSEYQSTIVAERAKQCDERDRVEMELNEIRVSLGEVAPAEVGLLVEERDLLRAEVLRLGDEIRDLRQDQSAHVLLAAELEGRVGELDAARRELAVLGGKVTERDVELDSARALHAGLTHDHQAAIDEIKTLQTSLDDRDRAIRRQADRHNAERENHVKALDLARQPDRGAIERLEAELVALRERHSSVGEELHARVDLCTQLQNRILELEEAQETIKSEYQSTIEAERTKQEELANKLLQQSAKSDKVASSHEQSVSTHVIPSDARLAMSATLQTALTQIEDLKQWLTESERLNRDMAALLQNIGINYSPPVRR